MNIGTLPKIQKKREYASIQCVKLQISNIMLCIQFLKLTTKLIKRSNTVNRKNYKSTYVRALQFLKP